MKSFIKAIVKALLILLGTSCSPSEFAGRQSASGTSGEIATTRPEKLENTDGALNKSSLMISDQTATNLTTGIVFSPAWPMLNDYDSLGDASQQQNWDSISGAYDFVNYHLATFESKWHTLGNQTHYDNVLARMNRNAGVVVELQAVAGLQHLAADRGVPITTIAPACGNSYDLARANLCGQYAADAAYYDASGVNGTFWGLNRMKKSSGPTVKALLLDSFFWDAAANFGWDATLTVEQTKSMVQYFLAGFIDRMRQVDHLGPTLQIWAISHFKYEFVAGKRGINSGCYNSCRRTGNPAKGWLQEDIMFAFILPALSGRVNAVLFDHSWSAYSVSQDDCSRWKRMNSIVKATGTPAGEFIIGADYLWGQSPHEGWFGGPVPANITNNRTAFEYRMSQLDIIRNQYPAICSDPNFDNHKILIVGTWQKYPSHTFSTTGGPDLRKSLKCAAFRIGKVAAYSDSCH